MGEEDRVGDEMPDPIGFQDGHLNVWCPEHEPTDPAGGILNPISGEPGAYLPTPRCCTDCGKDIIT